MKKTQNNRISKVNASAMLYMQHSQVMVVYNEQSDKEVWASFKSGDEAAFNYIYRKHVLDLYNYGMQVCQNDELVRDCLQKMFVNLRKTQNRLGDVQRIKGYLFTVFHRDLFKEVKKWKKNSKSIIPLEEEEQDNFFIESCHETKLIAEEFAREMKEELVKALNKLPTKQRQAILMLYQEELSYKEIADIMEFREVKTARTLVYRAMEKLKELFEVEKI